MHLTRLVPALLAGLLAACSSSPSITFYQLRAEPPGPPVEVRRGSPVWQILSVQLPAYLDRESVLRPTGRTALTALPSARWAEPLRDAVPRLLLSDLARLRGGASVYAVAMPPGIAAARQLKVEIQRLDAEPDSPSVVLTARWWLQDPQGREAPAVRELSLQVDSASASADDLVAAHRELLWRLAQAIAEV
ncbi:MAG: membrane integrity-associated transporter subunit PqiC [Burkholderiales bacterium]|nr:membrane integrity-associated transporter subunit PqiC [Burkholderiales bacterium]